MLTKARTGSKGEEEGLDLLLEVDTPSTLLTAPFLEREPLLESELPTLSEVSDLDLEEAREEVNARLHSVPRGMPAPSQ